MKKVVFIMFLLLVALVGCNNQNSPDNVLKKASDLVTLPSTTTENLELPSTVNVYNQIVSITWESSNQAVITNDGVVQQMLTNQAVTLEATFSYENKTTTKRFNIDIPAFTQEELLQYLLNTLAIPTTVESDLTLPTNIKLGNDEININWSSSNQDILTNTGVINKQLSNKNVSLTASFSYLNQTLTHTFNLTISGMTPLERINYVAGQINIPTSTKTNINLPTLIERVGIAWESSNPSIISKNGIVSEVDKEILITLTANFSYLGEKKTITYQIKVLPLTPAEKIQKVLDQVSFSNYVLFDNLHLQTSFQYGIIGTWTSSNPNALSNGGIVNRSYAGEKVILTLTLILEGETMSKTFEFTIGSNDAFPYHTYIERAQNFVLKNFNNVKLENNKLVLENDALIGSYESNVIETNEFVSAVASWSALSGTDHTVELLVKVLVNGVWSDYLSYQPWGLGLQNKGKDQTSSNNVAKLDDDIIVINNGKASAFQFKVVLRRNNLTSPSPKVSLVCVTLEIPNYEYPIEADLPDFIDYDVPKLNQNIVPQIGNSICSPTSITMLLKYKGHSFIQYDEDEYEHRYIANLAKDYGNNIFGNWVYNTVTASAFGHDAYVKRMYSFEELMYHLQTVGPVAASVKGNMQGLYTTNGHLIVVRGYRITPTKTTVIVNDPNLKDVYFEYNLDVFLNVWRNIVYVIE